MGKVLFMEKKVFEGDFFFYREFNFINWRQLMALY